MTTVDIGAARVHVVADMTDWDAAIQSGINAANGFSTQAQRAFDSTEGSVRRAAARLLDVSRNIGTTQQQMEQYVRVASRAGVTQPITDAAIANWQKLQKEIAGAQIKLAQIAQTEQNTQRNMNTLLGVGDGDAALQAQRRADAEAALVPLLQAQEREYAGMYDLAKRINQARDEARAQAAQQDFNSLLGVGDGDDAERRIRRQTDARSALVQVIQQQAAAEDAAYGQNADVDRFIKQLENLRDTAGKTHYELLQMRAAQLGVSDKAKGLIEGIQAQNEAMGAGTMTTKQYEWAMRGLPAQLTDITVGLATGQKPWMVFLQQGGQLKDMFHGIVPAAKAVGGAVWALINPWTIGAVAIGALAFAAYDASKSMEALAISVAKGDGIAGTAEEMYALADAINAVEGVNLGSAEAAVARLAATGKLAGDNLKMAAEASARWASVTGEGVDDVASKFESIAKGPLEAIESGQIRVTEAQYEHIKSLVAAGDQQQAVNELTKIYYDTVNNNSERVEAHLAATTRYWQMVKDNIGEAARGLGDFVNGLADYAVRYEATYKRLVAQGRWGVFAQVQALYADAAAPMMPTGGDDSSALYDADQAKRDKQRTEQLARWSATADQAATRQNTLNKLQEEGVALGQTQAAIDAVKARQQAQWAEQDAKRNKTPKGRQGNDGTQAIRDAAAAERAAITTQTTLLQSQYDQRQITVEEYYSRLQGYADQELSVTLRSIEAQKAAVAGREDSVQRLSQLESQAARAREQNQQRFIELSEGERQAIQQREIAYRDYVLALDKAIEATQRDADLEVASVSMGAKRYGRMVAINEQLRRRAELEDELSRRVADGNLEPGDAERYRDALERVNDQIDIMVDGFDRVDEAQSSAFAGIQRATEDWLETTRDVAGQWYDIMSSAIGGLGDGIANMLGGSEQDWDAYFQSLHIKILQFIVNQQLSKLVKKFMPGGGDENEAAALSGAAGKLAASAAPLYGAATALTAAAAALAAAGAGGAGGGGAGGSGWAGMVGSWFTKNAKGGVYEGSGLAAYRNQIVSAPTVFPFAKGGVPNVGLMGEAGHEGIFPLARTSSGDLGVRVVESGRKPTTINQTFVVQGTPDRTTREQMAQKVGRESSRAMSRSS